MVALTLQQSQEFQITVRCISLSNKHHVEAGLLQALIGFTFNPLSSWSALPLYVDASNCSDPIHTCVKFAARDAAGACCYDPDSLLFSHSAKKLI